MEGRNNVLQHSIGFNSGKYEQIIPVVALVFIFQSAEGRKAHKRWPLLHRLCKHGMALITDAYLGVTSEAGHLLFLSVLCSLLCLSAIQPQGKHMQKGALQLWSVFLLKEPQLSDVCLATAAVPRLSGSRETRGCPL